MFLPGVSAKVKLVAIAVLVILVASLVGTALAAVNQVVAEGNGQIRPNRQEPANVAGSMRQSSDEHPVVSGLKLVCPFH